MVVADEASVEELVVHISGKSLDLITVIAVALTMAICSDQEESTGLGGMTGGGSVGSSACSEVRRVNGRGGSGGGGGFGNRGR
jgi:uncharacterized membrane protein